MSGLIGATPPAPKLEQFVLDFMRNRALDPAAIQKAVREANAGRDGELARVEASLQEAITNYQQVSKTITKLLDALEADGANTKVVMGRLREREKIAEQSKAEMAALESRRDALKVETLDAEVVAEGYAKLPALLEEAERTGARHELKALLQSVIRSFDGLGFDEHTVLIALGVDTVGKKHVLGIHEGTTENAASCGKLLDDLIVHGAPPGRSGIGAHRRADPRGRSRQPDPARILDGVAAQSRQAPIYSVFSASLTCLDSSDQKIICNALDRWAYHYTKRLSK